MTWHAQVRFVNLLKLLSSERHECVPGHAHVRVECGVRYHELHRSRSPRLLRSSHLSNVHTPRIEALAMQSNHVVTRETKAMTRGALHKRTLQEHAHLVLDLLLQNRRKVGERFGVVPNVVCDGPVVEVVASKLEIVVDHDTKLQRVVIRMMVL
jgi:hypothetical protein